MKKQDFYIGLIVINIPLILVLLVVNILAVIGKLLFNPLNLFLVSLLILAAFNVLYYFFISGIKKSMDSLAKPLESLAQGDVNATFTFRRWSLFSFELLNQLVSSVFTSLRKTLAYIDKITNDDLDSQFEPHSKNDLLGIKLIELNDRLKRNKAELEKSKAEDERRNWVANGLAKFSDILRQDHENIEAMGYDIVSNLIDYIGFNQGALYVLNEEREEDIYYEILAAVAYNREKVLDQRIKLGETLVGRCAYEQKSIYMLEIPDHYINITSGLGMSNPKTLLIVPCILDDKVYGIIEVASFKPIEKFQIEFIEKLGESIASSIANARTRERTSTLLEASQHQSEELAAQEEELRQNLEEMETTQEDLKRQMDLNSELRQTMIFEKFLFDALLEKVPARVFFKDRYSRFIKASKSAVQKFGKDSYEELVGLSDADLLNPEFAKKTMADERKIMENRKGMYNFIEHETLSDGSDIWKSVSKIPLINENDECLGIFGIISDITEFKLAEVESERFKTNLKNLTEVISTSWLTLSLSSNGNVLRANQLFCERFKTDNQSLENQPVDELLSKFTSDKIGSKLNDILEGKALNIERTYNIDGEEFILNEHYVAIELEKHQKEILMVANIK